jgi:histone deacetylase HOS3
MSSPQTAIYLQDACLSHRYIRNAEMHNVVERPERLRAVKAGLAAALARLEEVVDASSTPDRGRAPPDDLATALEQLRLGSASPAPEPAASPISTCANVVRSEAKVDLLNHAAVKFVHGDIDGEVYLEKLISWAKGSEQRIAESGSEIPEEMSQGDLYCAQLVL